MSNEYSTLFKIKLNGEDTIVVGKQNFAFERPYSENFTEKHYNSIRTFDSFPKTYFTDRDDSKKKDVIIPSVNSQDIVQIGDRFISLNGLSNNPILYNGYANRFFGKYYYDYNQFVYAEFDSDLWSSILVGFDEQDITKLEENKNLILVYLKEHYYNNDLYIDDSVLDNDQWGAALERRRSGYKSIQDVDGITLYSNPDFITPGITEAPTNSYYEIDNTWIWNTVDASTAKPIYTNFSRFQNNLSPLSMNELDFEALNKPKFRLWRKYNNIGKYDETNMWASYNLELPKKNDETANLWKLGSEYQPVSNAYPNSDQFISDVGKDNGFIDGYSFAVFFDGATLKYGEPLLELKDNDDNVIFSIGDSPHQQIYLNTGETITNSTNNNLVHYNWINKDNNALNPDNNYKDIINDIPNSSLITNAIDNTLNTYDNIHSSKVINYGTELTYETQSILNFNNIADEYIQFELEYDKTGTSGSKDITININSTTYRETFGCSKNTTIELFDNNGTLNANWNKEYTYDETIENSTETDDDDNESETDSVSELNESENVKYKLQEISFTDTNEHIVKLFIDDITFSYSDNNVPIETKLNSLGVINIASIKIFEFDKDITTDSTVKPINVYDISNGVIDNSSETYIYCDKSKYHYYYGIQKSDSDDSDYTIDYSNFIDSPGDVSDKSIKLSYTYSTYLEDFYHHKLESDINLGGNIENETDSGTSQLSTQFKVFINDNATDYTEVGLNSSTTISNTSSDNLTVKVQLPGIYSKYDFIKLFGAQFNISINSDYYKISDSEPIKSNKNLVKTTYSDGSINCTLVGEGFDIDNPLGSIIDYDGIVVDSFNDDYESMYKNLLNYTFDDNISDTDPMYPPDHIKTNLRLNIERKVNTLSDSECVKFTASDGTKQTHKLTGGYTYIINFISNKTNDYPIEITLDEETAPLGRLSPNSNILTSKIDLSNKTNKNLNINFGDAQVFNNSNTNNISLIIEQYKDFVSLDDNWFNSYTYIQHKTIEASTSKSEIFDQPITAECCFVQDITNVNVPINFYSTSLNDKIYEIDLDECFYIGLQDMTDIQIDSNAAGNILHMYYIGFKSPVVFSNYRIKYSTLTDEISDSTIATIKTYDSVNSDNIYLDKNDIITTNITFDNLSENNCYIIRYNTVDLSDSNSNFNNYNALSKLWQGTSYYVFANNKCKLTIGDGSEKNKSCTYSINKSKTTIISTVNLPPDFKRILKISSLRPNYSVQIKLWPVYTNYFTNANYFTNSNVTPVQQSITFDTKLNIDYIENLDSNTISFEHSNRLREFLTYRTVPFISIDDNTETTIDDSTEFNLINEEQSFFVSEPVIENESDKILANLNENMTNNQSNVYGVKFGGFSIYGDRINVRKPQLHQSFIDTLTSVGFSVVFNNDETLSEGSADACTLNVFVNGKLISNTSYTKGSATDEFYRGIDFSRSLVKFGENCISRLNYIRSFNYAVNDSVFNLLYTKYRNYENIENTANIIYDYSIYDDINLYGDWQQTDDSIFSKQVLNISSDTDLTNINLRDYVIAVRFSPYQYKANYFNTIYTNAVNLEDKKDSYTDDERLYLIKDFDFIDRISGLNRLNNGEGKASNLYSLRITNSGFNTNNYDPINQPEDYKLQELINNTCRTSLENAIATITQKFQPINTQLFKVIYDDVGFTS